MKIKRIHIKELGGIKDEKFIFSDKITKIKARYYEEIAYAIKRICNHSMPQAPPSSWLRKGTKISASVTLGSEKIKLVLYPNKLGTSLELLARDSLGNDITYEYTKVTLHCIEQDNALVFDGKKTDYQISLLKYIKEEAYFDSNELLEKTAGYSKTRAFRSYLTEFIREFEPQSIRDGKYYKIALSKNGTYELKIRGETRSPMYLSETEQRLFSYLCFLNTIEFWHGFDYMRNLNCIKKPLLISELFERIDRSVDTSPIISRTKALNRQAIILTI